MTVCKLCGVELERGMERCPLCDTSVNIDAGRAAEATMKATKEEPAGTPRYLLGRILWQITSVLLLSGIVATLAINLAIQGEASWSLYPVTICLILFSYTALMAMWNTRRIVQVFTAWFLSILVLFIVDWYAGVDWAFGLALPILCAINVIGFALHFILRQLKQKGLNGLAIVFIAIAVLCLMIDGIVSFYVDGVVTLRWSVIVTACLLPVVVAILFMYFRTRNNAELKKIFHT